MNSQEFFKILIGEPPLEVELEIEMKCREVEELPESIMKAYAFSLVKENKMQDLLIMAAMQRITDSEIKLLRTEMALHHYKNNLTENKKKVKKTTIFTKIKAMLGIVS